MQYLIVALACLLFTQSSLSLAAMLVYSGNLDSELEPCGCSEEGDLGGFRRHATVLNELRTQHPELVALSTGGLTKTDAGYSPLKHQFIRSGKALLRYDAIGVQWSDLAEGLTPALKESLPWVASNWRAEDFTRSRLVQRSDMALEFFQWLDPATSPYRTMKLSDAPILAEINALEPLLKQAHDAGRVVVLGTTLTLADAKAQLPLRWVDILVIQSAYERFSEPQKVEGLLVLQPGSRGMRLGVLEFSQVNGRITAWSHRVISMPDSVANSPSMEPWYRAYNEAVKIEYKQKIADIKAKKHTSSPFAGEAACVNCHPVIVDNYAKSRHAHAFATLERVEKDFDPECIACHVVGWGKEGGFIDAVSTAHLKNVQCENCHGARAEHAKSGVKMHTPKPGLETCQKCHNAAHSPSFDFDTYWSKIKH